MAESSGLLANKVEPLSGANYQVWAMKVGAVLKTRKLFREVIEGIEPAGGLPGSKEEKEREKWESKNDEAFGIIILTLSQEQAGMFIGESNAKKVWEELKHIHTGTVEDKRIDIGLELKNIKQGSNESVDEYITKARNVAARSAALGQVIAEREIVYHVVRGLHGRLNEVAAVLRPQRGLRLDEIQQALREEENRQSKKHDWKESNTSDRAYRAKERYKPQRTEVKKCYVCGKANHLAKECWYKQEKKWGHNTRTNTTNNNNRTGNQRREPWRREQANVASGSGFEHAFNMSTDKDTEIDDQDIRIWNLDSGCTRHMTPHCDWMTDIELCETQINMAEEGRSIQAEGVGKVRILTKTCEGIKEVCVHDVLYVPKLRTNLMSVKGLLSKGNQVTFKKGGALISNVKGEVVAEASMKERMFIVECTSNRVGYKPSENNMAADTDDHQDGKPMTETDERKVSDSNTSVEVDRNTWHRRLGHLNEKYMDMMKLREMGIETEHSRKQVKECEECILGKITQKPFKRVEEENTSRALELVHMDLCGPMRVDSIGGARYMFVLVDSYSRRIFVYFISAKTEVIEKFQEFKNKVENEKGVKIKCVRSDNGTEFVNRQLQNLFKNEGIQHQRTVVYSPQSNGVAERANRTLLDIARTMLLDAGLDARFWAEAIATAVYVKNCTPTKKNKGKTAMELWSGSVPKIKHLRVFGCVAYFLIPKVRRSKFEAKGEKGIFVGYSTCRQAYRIYQPEQGTIVEARTVKFNEEKKGGDLLGNMHRGETNNISQDDSIIFVYEDLGGNESDSTGIEENSDEERDQQEVEIRHHRDNIGRPKGMTNELSKALRDIRNSELEQSEVNQGMRRSERIRNKNNQEHVNSAQVKRDGIPMTYEAATLKSDKREKWKIAMETEMNSLRLQEVWELVDRPVGMKVIKNKWVFSEKTNLDGTVQKEKARLVAMGTSQVLGIDYEESFAPVIRLESLRTIIALASQLQLQVRQFDVKAAYLNAELKEIVYMEQPKGFVDEQHVQKVCKLKKSLYGLPQAGKHWNEKLNSALLAAGLCRMTSDPCVYTLHEDNKIFILGVYVDDNIAAGTDDVIIEDTMQRVKGYFEMTEINGLGIFLGLEITRIENGFEITQKQYVRKVLERFNMDECNPSKTPGDPNQDLEVCDDSRNVDEKMYQKILGSLMYLSVGTRPDITYSISYLSQFSKDPKQSHLTAVKRVMRYLKGTQNYGLMYDNVKGDINVSTDANWNSGGSAKSFSGITVKIGNALIGWRSQKQNTVALSTFEAEICAISDGLRELQWTVGLVTEIRGNKCINLPLVIRTDNKTALDWVKTLKCNKRSKHVNRKYNHVKDEIEKGNVNLVHVRTEEMEADVLTKFLTKEKLLNCITKMGVMIQENEAIEFEKPRPSPTAKEGHVVR